MVCSFSSTVARIWSSFCAFSLRSTSSRCSTVARTASSRCSFDLRELGEPVAELLQLLDLRPRHPGELLLHRLRLLREGRAQLRARRLRGRRLLGARVGEILPQVALEIGAGGREHLEPRAQLRRLARRGVARAPPSDPIARRARRRPARRRRRARRERRRNSVSGMAQRVYYAARTPARAKLATRFAARPNVWCRLTRCAAESPHTRATPLRGSPSCARVPSGGACGCGSTSA